MFLIIHFLASNISKKFHDGIWEWESGIVVSGKMGMRIGFYHGNGNGNGNGVMGMGGNGNGNSPSRTPLERTSFATKTVLIVSKTDKSISSKIRTTNDIKTPYSCL